jgi:hypothetical protein
MIVKPANDTQESRDLAETLTKIVDRDLKRRETRRAVSIAFKHLPIYFIGALKYRWDNTRGNNGDYVIEFVHPNNLTLDSSATTSEVRQHNFISEKLSMTLEEAISRFPNKRSQLLGKFGIDTDNPSKKGLQKVIDIDETWFKWFDSKGDVLSGVCWIYDDLMLAKMKNPNFDFEGELKLKEDIPIGDIETRFMRSMMFGDDTQDMFDKVYYNILDEPEFPYVLLGYDQLGRSPYDETSRIEQVSRLQESMDEEGRIVDNMLKKSRGKYIFSKKEGFTDKVVSALDMDDPATDLVVDGDANKGVQYIPADQPSAALFENRIRTKSAIFEKSGVNDTTRGKISNTTATGMQIAREMDFGRIDDLTEETINYAFERLALGVLQLIRLRYTEDHLIKIVGDRGKVDFITLNRDSLENGMEVEVSASATDKADRKRLAVDLASQSLSDPLTFFEDLGVSNPEKRVERLISYQLDVNAYAQKYLPNAQIVAQPQELPNEVIPEGVAEGEAIPSIM